MPASDTPPVEQVGDWVAAQLWGWPSNRMVDAVTVIEELVDNAYQFALPPYAARMTLSGDRLTVLLEVHDSGFAPSAPWQLGDGLHQVAAAARSWGMRRRRLGKVVWAELSGCVVDRDGQR